MININGQEYEFKFTLKRIELIENALGESLMSILVTRRGLVSLSQARTIFTYALKQIDGPYLNAVNSKMTEEAFEKTIEETGYTPLVAMIMEAFERDCPFFFQTN